MEKFLQNGNGKWPSGLNLGHLQHVIQQRTESNGRTGQVSPSQRCSRVPQLASGPGDFKTLPCLLSVQLLTQRLAGSGQISPFTAAHGVSSAVATSSLLCSAHPSPLLYSCISQLSGRDGFSLHGNSSSRFLVTSTSVLLQYITIVTVTEIIMLGI